MLGWAGMKWEPVWKRVGMLAYGIVRTCIHILIGFQQYLHGA